MSDDSYCSYDAEDFSSLLDDLADEGSSTSAEDHHSKGAKVESNVPVRRYRTSSKTGGRSNKRKVAVVSECGQLVEFEAAFPKPRILKSDVRRSLSSMFVNAVNSGDMNLVYGFFDTFCVPTFFHSTVRSFKVGSIPKQFATTSMGVENSVANLRYGISKIPDAVILLKETCLLTKEDGSTSRVSSTFSFRATRLFDDPVETNFQMPKELESDDYTNNCPDNTNEQSDSNPFSTNALVADKLRTVRGIVATVDKYTQKLVVRKEPVHIHAEGELVMHLDKLSRITRIDMISTAAGCGVNSR